MFNAHVESPAMLLQRQLINWPASCALLFLILCGTVVCAQETAKATPKPSASAAKDAKPSGPEKRLLVHRRFLRIPVCETSELQDLSITASDGEASRQSRYLRIRYNREKDRR